MKFFRLPLITLFLFSCSQVKLIPGGGEELAGVGIGKEIVKYKGGSIHQGYLDLLAKINPRIKSQLDNPAMRRQVLNSLVDQELMYDESARQGLNRDKDVLEKAALYKKVIIAQALVDRAMEIKAKKEYDEKKDTDFTKVEISHIQVNFKSDVKPEGEAAVKDAPPTDADKQTALKKASDIRARLLAGEDFAKLAEELSDDKISKKKGGSLGPVSKNDKRLARRGLEKAGELAFTLKKGDISEPIESKKGYHIIKVDAEPVAIAFEEAEKMIRFQIQKTAKDELLVDLRKKADIKFLEKEPETPPMPATPPVSLEGAPVPTPPAPEAAAPATPAPVAPAPPEAAPTAVAPAGPAEPAAADQPIAPPPSAPTANPTAPDPVFYKNTPMRQGGEVAPEAAAPAAPAPATPSAPETAPAAPAPQGNAPMGGT